MPRPIRPRSLLRTIVAAGVVGAVVLVAPPVASAAAPAIRTTGPLTVPIGLEAAVATSAGLPLLITDTDSVRSQVTVTATGATPSTALQVTLSTTDGLSFSSGDGTRDVAMSFSGLRADVNAALDGATVRARSADGGQALRIVADDDPGSGVGATDTEVVTVTVTDQDPVLALPAAVSVATGARTTLGSAASIVLSDADSPAVTAIASIVPAGPGGPTLAVPAIAGLEGSGQPPSILVSLTGTPALVQQGLRSMVLAGGGLATTAEIRVQVRDTPTDVFNEVARSIALTVTDSLPTIQVLDRTIAVDGATSVPAQVGDLDSPQIEVRLTTSQPSAPASAVPRIDLTATPGVQLRSGSFASTTDVTFTGPPVAIGQALGSVTITGGTVGLATYRVQVDDDPTADATNNVVVAQADLAVIDPPGPPTNVVAAASGDQVRLSFTAPTIGGDEAVAAYRIYRTVGGVTTRVADTSGTGTSIAFDTDDFGIARTYAVAAITTSGAVGPRSAASSPLTPQRFLPYASVDAMVSGLYADLLGRAPTSTERSATAALITGGPRPSSAIGPIRASAESQSTVDAVTRLYRAYFLRIPDAGGLRFWLGRKRGGTKLDAISQSFATSSEFTSRYGSLTNRQFVELIYQNLFARTGDAAGVTFWTGQLDSGRRNRGSVMAGFSESGEYRRKQASAVEVSALYVLLLGRAPTVAEHDAGVALAAASVASLHSMVLSSPLLDARVS